jgi:hypothetical protein
MRRIGDEERRGLVQLFEKTSISADSSRDIHAQRIRKTIPQLLLQLLPAALEAEVQQRPSYTVKRRQRRGEIDKHRTVQETLKPFLPAPVNGHSS